MTCAGAPCRGTFFHGSLPFISPCSFIGWTAWFRVFTCWRAIRRKWTCCEAATHPHFDWTSPAGCPDDLPLFLLQEGDARALAAQLSCGQDIAGQSAFSLGMIAEFEPSLRQHGPWFYRRLFWETGLIGQVLYLEAEAAGVRATGIGCFFDDPVHQVMGFNDASFQSLYHFTTGGPVDDPRLTTLPPYGLDH